jgi:hypothetical protein
LSFGRRSAGFMKLGRCPQQGGQISRSGGGGPPQPCSFSKLIRELLDQPVVVSSGIGKPDPKVQRATTFGQLFRSALPTAAGRNRGEADATVAVSLMSSYRRAPGILQSSLAGFSVSPGPRQVRAQLCQDEADRRSAARDAGRLGLPGPSVWREERRRRRSIAVKQGDPV